MLRLPPYHPELNPIELIWAMVKNWVGRHNTAFNFNEVERLAREKFAAIGANEWGPICQKVERLELELLQKEHTEDTNSDLRFTVNTASSSDEYSSDSDSSDSPEFPPWLVSFILLLVLIFPPIFSRINLLS